MFQTCPVCGQPDRVVLVPEWQATVNDPGLNASAPIVGCGNPWHYGLGAVGAQEHTPERRS